tara:strand:- start:612 stop:1148 length:537 start_codon:yes stop_codon:yes gene_type:complete
MAIILKIQRTATEKQEVEKVILKARRTLDGKILIGDHPEVDITILPKINKIVAFPKAEMDDEIYETQKRLFDHLVKYGVVEYDSIQGGNLFMSMEAKISEMKEGDNIQYLLYAVSVFLEKDLPFYNEKESFEKEMEKRLLEPEIDEFTEHNPERFHRQVKGSLRPNMRPYGISTIYRI